MSGWEFLSDCWSEDRKYTDSLRIIWTKIWQNLSKLIKIRWIFIKMGSFSCNIFTLILKFGTRINYFPFLGGFYHYYHLLTCLANICRRNGRDPSISLISVENLLTILPTGVTSKKDTGVFNTAFNSFLWRTREARMLPNACTNAPDATKKR